METGDLVTKGVKDPETGLKDFEISTPHGEHFFVKRVDGNRWESCGTVFKTIAAVKHAICSGSLSRKDEESVEMSPTKARPTWGCIHPCVFMILGDELGHDLRMETLCNYGYLGSDGNPDIARARAEFRGYIRRSSYESNSPQCARAHMDGRRSAPGCPLQ